MKLLLIAPASGNWNAVARRRLARGKAFRFSLLSLLSVAAETPPDVEVRIVDEQIEEIPWHENFDLVGITCMTALAPRSYRLAERFRSLGTPVVLGGMHPTFCPEEALRFADAVVAGEAEGVWPQVVEDARNGRLQPVYRREAPPCLASLRPAPRHLLASRHYATINAVQATRGCPHSCDFCAISAFSQSTQRARPPEHVAREVASFDDRFFLFVDDNLLADREYAADLFERLVPLGKHWIAQGTLSLGEDPELASLAARAGCFGLFAGMESFSQSNLSSVGKSCNRVDRYRESVERLHSLGIGVEAGLVFGFDHDEPDVFQNTLAVLDRLGIDLIQASILTPLPGTRRFEAMRDQVACHDWAQYDFHHAVFDPRGMAREELQAGHDWVTREFYRPRRIARRLAAHARRPGGVQTIRYVAALNMAYFGRVRTWGIRGRNPAADSSRSVLPIRRRRLLPT